MSYNGDKKSGKPKKINNIIFGVMYEECTHLYQTLNKIIANNCQYDLILWWQDIDMYLFFKYRVIPYVIGRLLCQFYDCHLGKVLVDYL